MRVLVTGGMGYLGSPVVKELSLQGFSVKILDSLMYGDYLSASGIEFELVKGDIRDESALNNSLNHVDAVVHLAAIVGEPADSVNKEATVNINYVATRQLAKICKNRGIRLIFMSTCSVYGARPDMLLNEQSEVYPLSLYAVTKLAAEETVEKLNGDRSTIFRLGTLFGLSPRMRFDLVVNRFIGQAIQDRKITVFGGSQCRPFIHVRDVAIAIANALTAHQSGIYNLIGFNCKILDAARIIQKKTNCHVSVFEDLKDPRNYMVDPNLAINTFGIKLTHTIEDAITEIEREFANGSIKDYREWRYSNEECLKRAEFERASNARIEH
jgi:nucleoside-diphosphate-sugar epimerase